jgi:4-amino-4-deoxy-L-arabinose transferase-like glycosyltransferase
VIPGTYSTLGVQRSTFNVRCFSVSASAFRRRSRFPRDTPSRMVARPMSNRFAAALIVAVISVAAGVYLVGNGSVALWDRDEPRYAQTSRQMLETGDWVVPHYLDMVRTAKPAMIYWCQAAAMRVFGVGSFAARFPSSLSIVLLLIGLVVVLWRYIDPQRAAWTVFVLATAGMTIVCAKFCITDALLLLWVTIAQVCLYTAWRGRATWPVVVTWAVAVGLAGLTKGPVVLGMQLVTLLALGAIRVWDSWSVRSTGVPPVPGDPGTGGTPVLRSAAFAKAAVWLAIVTAVVLPWVLMVNYRASAFLSTTFHHDVWDRMMTPLEQHSGPPGYYLLLVWATFFPWSLLLPLAVGSAWVRRADQRLRFALAAVAGPWIMLECFRTKLPFYFLPAFPPLAFLVADAIVRTTAGELNDLRRRTFVIVAEVWSGLVIALVSAIPLLLWLFLHEHMPIPVIFVLDVVAIAFGGTVWWSFNRRRVLPGFLAMGFGTLLLIAAAYGLYLPGAQFLRVSPNVAAILIDHGVTHPHEALMIGYAEPTLAFYQGGTIREGGKIGFVRVCQPQFTPWIVLPKTMFDAAPEDLRRPFEVVGSVHGMAYADKGKWVDVLVLHKRDAAR